MGWRVVPQPGWRLDLIARRWSPNGAHAGNSVRSQRYHKLQGEARRMLRIARTVIYPAMLALLTIGPASAGAVRFNMVGGISYPPSTFADLSEPTSYEISFVLDTLSGTLTGEQFFDQPCLGFAGNPSASVSNFSVRADDNTVWSTSSATMSYEGVLWHGDCYSGGLEWSMYVDDGTNSFWLDSVADSPTMDYQAFLNAADPVLDLLLVAHFLGTLDVNGDWGRLAPGTMQITASEVPGPTSIWLLATGLVALRSFGRRRSALDK